LGRQLNNRKTMINQKHCPICKTPAVRGCAHLAVAVEGRDFVRRCVELCQGERQWRAVCEVRHRRGQLTGEWSPEQEDFTWLETAFCEEFLKRLRWFGGMDHEWRSGPKLQQGGFWVLLWSKDPRRLWWELREEFERQVAERQIPKSESPSLKTGSVSRSRVERRVHTAEHLRG
jgi:hypothetical protein